MSAASSPLESFPGCGFQVSRHLLLVPDGGISREGQDSGHILKQMFSRLRFFCRATYCSLLIVKSY